jgi:hypothetical protein
MQQVKEETITITDNQEIIVRSIKTMVYLIQAIEYKLKNIISEEDSIIMLKLFFAGNLFQRFSEKMMNYTSRYMKNLELKTEMQAQFKLELTNIWNDFIMTIDEFETPIKLGKFIKEFFSEKFFEKDGLLDKLTYITFDILKDRLFQYDQTKATYNKFTADIVEDLISRYEKYEKLKRAEE